MQRQITIGGNIATDLLENLELPLLDEFEAVAWVEEAIDQAASQRKGTAVMGAKGTGKSIAVEKAMAAFEDTERELMEAANGGYRRRRAVWLHSPRSDRYSEVVGEIYYEVAGMRMRLRRGSYRKSDDELLDELVEKLLGDDIAVIVMDEAECLSDTGLRVLRDLMSIAESKSRKRHSSDSQQPRGVGVTLLGTFELRSKLNTSKEVGHRWVRVIEIDPLGPADAAEFYRRALPSIDEYAEGVGANYWQEFVKLRILQGHTVPARFLENHIRLYARWCAGDDPSLSQQEDIPFDEEMFEDAAVEQMALMRSDDE